MLTLMVAAFASCSQSDLEEALVTAETTFSPEEDDHVRVMLGINVGTVTMGPAATRMSGRITQTLDANTFRGMNNIWMIPFDKRRAVAGTDQSNGWATQLPSITGNNTLANVNGYDNSQTLEYGLVANNNAHLWGHISLPYGTSSLLVYGKAIDSTNVSADPNSVAFRHQNGLLSVAGIEGKNIVPSSITFSPVPIHTARLTEGAQLASILNDLLHTSYTYTLYYRRNNNWQTVNNNVLNWGSSGLDATLQNLYTSITNNGNQIAGSGKAVVAMLTSLYRELKSYNSTNTTALNYNYNGTNYTAYYASGNTNSNYYLRYQRLYNGLRDNLIAKIETYANVSGNGTNASPYELTLKGSYAAQASYPANYGLPEGCAALEWSATNGFTVVGTAGNVLITPTETYCYPPNLYYYTNSQIKTSEVDDEHEHYISSNDWNAILNYYDNDNAAAYPQTRSVAVKEPMRYGVALLRARVKVDESVTVNTLDDNSPTAKHIDVSGNVFPVTGIIIGNQRKQAFNFTPMSEDIYFLYDNQMSNVYLRKGAGDGNYFETLVLQTPNDEDVPIALELQNNSGINFMGANGNIVPGSKFYLLGELQLSKAQGNNSVQSSVFSQAHVTEVELKVKDLKKAMNNIPDLRDPQLILGVALAVDWIQSTSVSIPLY